MKNKLIFFGNVVTVLTVIGCVVLAIRYENKTITPTPLTLYTPKPGVTCARLSDGVALSCWKD